MHLASLSITKTPEQTRISTEHTVNVITLTPKQLVVGHCSLFSAAHLQRRRSRGFTTRSGTRYILFAFLRSPHICHSLSQSVCLCSGGAWTQGDGHELEKKQVVGKE